MNKEFGQVIAIVKAAEMLGLIETPGQMVVIMAKGKAFIAAMPEERRSLWR